MKNSFRAFLTGAHTQMLANLVPCFHIKSTGPHEVLHYGQLTLLGCPVQGCMSIIIRVKEVALHLGGKVLSNHKMATNGTCIKGIEPSLHWTIRTGSEQITICAHMQGAPCWLKEQLYWCYYSNYTILLENTCMQWYMPCDNEIDNPSFATECWYTHWIEWFVTLSFNIQQ